MNAQRLQAPWRGMSWGASSFRIKQHGNLTTIAKLIKSEGARPARLAVRAVIDVLSASYLLLTKLAVENSSLSSSSSSSSWSFHPQVWLA